MQYPRVIYLQVSMPPNSRMDKYERRRQALKGLVDILGRGGIKKVAEAIDKAPDYVSRMLYEPKKPGKKNIGEDSWDLLIAAFPTQLGARQEDVEEALRRIANTAVSVSATQDNYVRVEQLDAEGDMGTGAINDEVPEVIKAIDYTPNYIRAVLGFVPPPGRLVLITGRGNSMAPVIQPGDSILVDMGIKDFDGDGLYLINSGMGEQVKALQDRGGAIYVVSANSELFPAYPATKETRVLGKVYLRNRIDRFN